MPPLIIIYRARYVMPVSAPLIEDGAVVVSHETIIAVGKNSDLRRDYPLAFFHDLGEVILMPGLINAHCHLDYTMMKGQLTPGASFTTWIEQLNKIKFALKEGDFLKAIVEGAEELRSSGCTTVCNIESFPELLLHLPSLPLRLWQCIEVMDIRGIEQGENGLTVVENFFKKKRSKGSGFGISPHAPQTASQELYRGASRLAQKYRVPFCTHLAESEEEMEMFARGAGPLFNFLKKMGRDMSDCGAQTPVQVLLENRLLPPGAMLVHMNVLTKKDRELLAPHGADFFVIHCPKTHQFFRRVPFDWKFFQEHGYPLLLGTDSLASNDSLNLFEEMRVMAASAPTIAPEEILKMVTLHPAAALGMVGRLGVLSHGAYADMIAIPFLGDSSEVSDAVLYYEEKPLLIASLVSSSFYCR